MLIDISELKHSSIKEISLTDINLIHKRNIISAEQYKNFIVIKYLNDLPCYNNLSNDYLPFSIEKKIFSQLNLKENNILYKVKKDQEI